MSIGRAESFVSFLVGHTRVIACTLAGAAFLQGCPGSGDNHNAFSTAGRFSANISALEECSQNGSDTSGMEMQSLGIDNLAGLLPSGSRRVGIDSSIATWMLGGRGGSVGFEIDSGGSVFIESLLDKSGAGPMGWCRGGEGLSQFVAKPYIGHRPTGVGAHLQAYWPVDDERHILMTGVSDSNSLDLLIKIAASLRVPTSADPSGR